MSKPDVGTREAPSRTNGSAAAALVSAGISCFILAVLAILGDKLSFLKDPLTFYKPTGPLSGVTTVAILLWLITWGILEWRWRSKTVDAARTSVIALTLFVLGLILTFPPVADLF